MFYIANREMSSKSKKLNAFIGKMLITYNEQPTIKTVCLKIYATWNM